MTDREKDMREAVGRMRLELELQNEFLWRSIVRYETTISPQFIEKDGKLTPRPIEEYWPEHVLQVRSNILDIIQSNQQTAYRELIRKFPELKV